MCASVNSPAYSVPTTQSPERNVGTVALWPLARGMLSKGLKEGKRGRGLTVGWYESECDGVFLQQLPMSAHPHVLSG